MPQSVKKCYIYLNTALVLSHIASINEIKILKSFLMEEIKEAVEEMKLIRAGKKKARNEDFLNGL